MKALRFLVLVPVWLLAVAAASPTPNPSPHPSPSPTPTPIPTNANIVLDTAAGGPNTKITVNGSMFLRNEPMTLFWDSPNKVAASVTSDGSGNFTTIVTPFAGDAAGAHQLCA